MNLAVVAFPRLDAADRQWIEAFRAEHDPQASRLEVHFTLVFPVEAARDAVAAEVATIAGSTAPFTFTIRRTQVVADAFGHGSHVFLVPDEGAAEISTLHDRLYAGTLKAHLRADIRFVPHMTVGASPDSASAKTMAQQLDGRLHAVCGSVDALTLVDVETPRVRRVADYNLV